MAATQLMNSTYRKSAIIRGILILALLIVPFFLASVSCTKTSTPLQPTLLPNSKVSKAIQIALDTTEAKDLVNKGYPYQIDLNWVGIVWQGSRASELWGLDYDVWEKGIPDNVPPSAVIYPRVDLYFGDPPEILLRIAVELSTEKAVFVDGHPLKKLPS